MTTHPRTADDPRAALETLRRPLHQLPDPLPIPTVASLAGTPPFNTKATITPPGSKSLTNRALLLAALADGDSTLHEPLTDADDAQRMLAALARLGIETHHDPAHHTLTVRGAAGTLPAPPDEQPIFLNNAGTATRFLTAAAVLADAPVVIDGNQRMRQRPIAELIALLRTLGVTVDELAEPGAVPVRIHPLPTDAPYRSRLTVPTTQSSQFVSALCMIAPHLPQGLTLTFEGEITSRAYIDMTLNLMRDTQAIEHEWLDDATTLHIPNQPTPAFEYDVEPDASGATYLFAAAALHTGLTVRVPGLAFNALQSDARFLLTLRSMGCPIQYAAGAADCTGPNTLAGLPTADFEQTPDAAMTLAAVAAFATSPTTITGLRTLRVKETDRLHATQTELARVGVQVSTTDDAMTITPPPRGPAADTPVTFHTYDDHRMAMATTLVATRVPNCAIAEPACVAKTYPDFFNHLANLYDRLIARANRF